MEKLFKIELTLKIETNRRDGGPDVGEVMEKFRIRLHGRWVPSVITLPDSFISGEGWSCIAINGEIK